MRFQNPAWLWALLLLPLAYYALHAYERGRNRRFGLFADSALWTALAPEFDPSARMRKARAWVLAASFALLAIARPQWGMREEVSKISGLDVMVVLDVSNSMEVEDVPPGRLRRAKHFLKAMLDRLGGDRIGVVAFAGSSYVACPLTTDLDYVNEVIQTLSPHSVQSQGTDIGTGLETARRSLERGGEDSQSSSQVILLVSDGEDHEDGAIQAAQTLKSQGIRTYVFGIGTERGGPIPLREENGQLVGYKKDRSGQPLISTFHPDALMKVTSSAGGRYWNMTPGESELDDLLAEMKGLSRSDIAERRTVIYQERFQWPLAFGVLFLLWELTLSVRRKRPGAQAAAVVLLVSFIGGLGGLSGCGTADSYFENEKGVKAFEEDRVEDAKRNFGNAQAQDPGSAELKFNQGSVQLRQAEPDAAAQSFAEAMTDAARSGNLPLAGKSAFNAAEALAKKGDTGSASALYGAAIEFAKKAKDAKLEEDARKNLELLIRQQEQKKNQSKDEQKNQKDQKQQEQQQKDQQQQQQQQDQQQDKKQNDQQKKDYRQNAKQQFRSLKLSDEDAERVMAELKERERELQNKLRKQGGKQQGGTGKDW